MDESIGKNRRGRVLIIDSASNAEAALGISLTLSSGCRAWTGATSRRGSVAGWQRVVADELLVTPLPATKAGEHRASLFAGCGYQQENPPSITKSWPVMKPAVLLFHFPPLE